MGKFIGKVKIFDFVKKYKYALLVFLAGVILMSVPIGSDTKKTETITNLAESYEDQVARQLSEILSKMHGVGKVEVLLTISQSGKTIYQTNINQTAGENGSSKLETVIITDSDRNESGMIQQVISPIYQGAIVVCQGADNAGVRLAIVEAVSKITGLGADKISVVKMK